MAPIIGRRILGYMGINLITTRPAIPPSVSSSNFRRGGFGGSSVYKSTHSVLKILAYHSFD